MSFIAGTPNAAGGMFSAPVGTALPQDVDEAINAAFKVLVLDEEGLSRSTDKETVDWRDWIGSIIRKTTKTYDVTYTGKIINYTFDSLCAVFGKKHVTLLPSGTIKVEFTAEDAPEQAFVFDLLDGDNVVRECVPKGQLIVSGEVKYSAEEPIGFPFTITALNPGNGVNVTQYFGQLEAA